MSSILVIGGARSGKSGYAEKMAEASGKEKIYIATAHPGDAEMARRIREHQTSRDASWITVEEPVALGKLLLERCTPNTFVLIDCLTLWLTNLLFWEGNAFPDEGPVPMPSIYIQQRAALLDAIDRCSGEIAFVSNEVGMGIVPQGAVSRWFVDEAGRLNQEVAARCDRVVWVAAGLPLQLKG